MGRGVADAGESAGGTCRAASRAARPSERGRRGRRPGAGGGWPDTSAPRDGLTACPMSATLGARSWPAGLAAAHSRAGARRGRTAEARALPQRRGRPSPAPRSPLSRVPTPARPRGPAPPRHSPRGGVRPAAPRHRPPDTASAEPPLERLPRPRRLTSHSPRVIGPYPPAPAPPCPSTLSSAG